MKVLVTGNAGFIGFHVARRLLERGDAVVGIDVVNDYYDPALKEARLKILAETAAETGSGYQFIKANLADESAVDECFADCTFDRVIHLAGQAGVRHSLSNPRAYIESNIVAFLNILEACRQSKVPHLTYASTSSVYGASTALPYSEHQSVDHPLQLYAATKRADELMAHAYSHLYRLPTTGLRFFSVYGPWGRPDMALYVFTKRILEGSPIQVFNQGNHTRDFTYIDDIVEGVVRTSDDIARPHPMWDSANPDPATSNAPFRIFNLGSSNPVQLHEYIETIERRLGKKAIKTYLPLQEGDIPATLADVSEIQNSMKYKPTTPVSVGVPRFVDWYLEFRSAAE